ncbi:ATP-grasp domain-containing protein [Sandaracinus amylolyticus]|uniref:Putative membrane protein n=1 Tax=Sandaracinus amylolyticus TaxID=927083 RepID=A0A0F6W9L6_9BACT|nr:ATP-grasp domain-containing protein [Sandaracinus amylolyticus]AKF10871.1 putative membrane protein [Sandaracinus amylolyticus]
MSRLAILFARPRAEQEIEDDFEAEALAAEELGIEAHEIDLDLVVDGDAERACARLPRGRDWLLRSWMLKEDEYESLEEGVDARRGRLITDARSYARATYLPEWYPELEDVTPASRWIEGADLDEAWDAARALGDGPWIVKDHVKSVKEQWLDACFVPEGAERARFDAVCSAMIEARGDRFERGIVVRRFVRLRELGYRMPERAVSDEHRLFFFEGALIAHAPYHDVEVVPLDVGPLRALAKRVDSPFFTIDVARTSDGGWTVIEVNDGGVSWLPAQLDPRALYERIAA